MNAARVLNEVLFGCIALLLSHKIKLTLILCHLLLYCTNNHSTVKCLIYSTLGRVLVPGWVYKRCLTHYLCFGPPQINQLYILLSVKINLFFEKIIRTQSTVDRLFFFFLCCTYHNTNTTYFL